MKGFLTPEEWTLEELFKGKYYIPIFQRPYSWQEEQVKQLMQDIDDSYSGYKKWRDFKTNVDNEEMLLFTGTFFLRNAKQIGNALMIYDVVDGQQRITTFTLLLMILLNNLYKINAGSRTVAYIEDSLWKIDNRRNDKNNRVLTLANIDKSIMIQLFDELFSKNDIVEFAERKIDDESLNLIEKNLLQNLIIISKHLDEHFSTEDEYCDFYDFLKDNIRFVIIKVNTKVAYLFNIFESINSKGKPLEEIDLIKSYIFQNISEDDYDEYIDKWGKLIIETNDNLMDYLNIYIRANISFYNLGKMSPAS